MSPPPPPAAPPAGVSCLACERHAKSIEELKQDQREANAVLNRLARATRTLETTVELQRELVHVAIARVEALARDLTTGLDHLATITRGLQGELRQTHQETTEQLEDLEERITEVDNAPQAPPPTTEVRVGPFSLTASGPLGIAAGVLALLLALAGLMWLRARGGI